MTKNPLRTFELLTPCVVEYRNLCRVVFRIRHLRSSPVSRLVFSSHSHGRGFFFSPPQCSPGMTSIDGARHQPTTFLLPGLSTQGERATLPSGIRLFPGRLGLLPRVARLFLSPSVEGKRAPLSPPLEDERAALPSGSRCGNQRLGYSPRAARLLSNAPFKGKRARVTKLCCCSPRWLAPDTTLARSLLEAPSLPGARGYYSSQLKA